MLKRFACLSLLLASPLAAQEGAPLPVPEPEPTYEMVDVVLETAMGDIFIALETERAPITAGNFLQYVDEGRFDGTVFYRVMKLKWDPQPNGLVQGGARYDPERILPPIAHEPTSLTGVLHTRGALSMARNDPGTANGDFSIMMQDLPTMNANPASAEPEWQAGYAAFGHVTQGMDVVEAIYNQPIDPEMGEGFMQGQMLAEPVEIIRARRATTNESTLAQVKAAAAELLSLLRQRAEEAKQASETSED